MFKKIKIKTKFFRDGQSSVNKYNIYHTRHNRKHLKSNRSSRLPEVTSPQNDHKRAVTINTMGINVRYVNEFVTPNVLVGYAFPECKFDKVRLDVIYHSNISMKLINK